MKQIIVKLDDRDVIVTKLALKKYSELLAALDELPKILSTIDSLKTEEIVTKIPEIVTTSLKDFTKIIVISTDLSEEQVGEIGIDDAVKIVLAIKEVNDFSGVWENIKKIFAQPKREIAEVNAKPEETLKNPEPGQVGSGGQPI